MGLSKISLETTRDKKMTRPICRKATGVSSKSYKDEQGIRRVTLPCLVIMQSARCDLGEYHEYISEENGALR